MRKLIIGSILISISLGCASYTDINSPDQIEAIDFYADPVVDEVERVSLKASSLVNQLSEQTELEYQTYLQTIGRDLQKEEDVPISPDTVIGMVQDANRDALRFPSHGKQHFQGGILSYTYYPGMLYQIYTTPGKITDLQLEAEEFLDSSPVIGDSMQWTVETVTSGSSQLSKQHILIKPLIDGLYTTLTLYTNKRVYYFELRSFSDTYMIGLKFNYPQDIGVSIPSRSMSTSSLTPENLYWNYQVSGDRKLHFYPKSVYSSETKTYIVFVDNIIHKELPTVWGYEKNKKALLNHRIKGNIMEIDAIPEKLILQLDKDDVLIRRN